MIHITIHLDGNTSECGYKFVVQNGPCAWCAFRGDEGFRHFLKLYGLKIDRELTQLHDMRACGRGRLITTACHNKRITAPRYFWNTNEIPPNAKPFIGLCNGSYVDCYVVDLGDTVDTYLPNPNAKNVYKPYNYFEMQKRYG